MKSILYVEDEPANARLMQYIMYGRPEVNLLVAPNGADGLRLAREERPAAILLDMHLPDMDGGQFLAELWKDSLLSAIPVIVVSGDPLEAQSPEFQNSGFHAYLKKPLEIPQLLQLLDRILKP